MMRTAEQVEALRQQMIADGTPRPDMIRQLALACLEWPYVFGAWGEECTPSGRKRRARDAHHTIVSKCQVLSGRASSCDGCKWYPDGYRVRMYDCRGFTAWLLRQVGLDIYGDGATTQYNTAKNWVQRGSINDLPDCVCCLFRKVGSRMEHTGMHVGGGLVVDCSVNVRTGGLSGWTHYAIPVGLYGEGEIPVETIKPTLRKGSKGDLVRELQERLNSLGYDCGEADGIFGTRTKNALVTFQTKSGLDPDGVCGPKTWTALEAAKPVDVPTYKVICYGMSWEQSMQIREICPTAEMIRE